ncbi:MAG: hypothetical protein F4213_19220 [Boseongicola sp. SB0677_bin_26]|nr:hypothetical protein [Boseongicola sp. SB0677_bin_26]
MTEPHAFRDMPPTERPDSESSWTDTVIATDLLDGAANAVTPPDPQVPARCRSAGLVAEDGTRLVTGLTWEIASGPEAPVLRGNAPPVLRLPTRRARLANEADDTCGSLLLAMAKGLARVAPRVSGPWAFIAEIPEPGGAPLLWMAVADLAPPEGSDGESDGSATPRPGPEGTFDDADEALVALQDLLAVTDVAGIAVSWTPVHAGMTPADTHRGRVIQSLACIAPDVPLHDVEPAPATPVFVPTRRVPVRLLGALGTGAAAFLAGVVVILPMIEEALRPDPLPAPEMVSVRVADGAFAGACTEALDAWWPRITGWRLDSAGCAMAGHLPEEPHLQEPHFTERTARPMVVWRHLVPESDRNVVLARAAADQVIASWPHEARLDQTSLTLWRTAALPLEPTEMTVDGPDPEAVRARLAALWADAPGAVTLMQEGRGPDLLRVATSGATSADAVLSRAARVPGIAPARLVQLAGGVGELVLAPVITRELDVIHFESTEGGLSK